MKNTVWIWFAALFLGGQAQCGMTRVWSWQWAGEAFLSAIVQQLAGFAAPDFLLWVDVGLEHVQRTFSCLHLLESEALYSETVGSQAKSYSFSLFMLNNSPLGAPQPHITGTVVLSLGLAVCPFN